MLQTPSISLYQSTQNAKRVLMNQPKANTSTQVAVASPSKIGLGVTPQKPGMISDHLLNQPITNEEDDDFIDDFLDDSMELQESNVNPITNKSKLSLRDPKEIILPATQSENKIYQSSPSKLNSKFQSSSKQSLPISTVKPSNLKPPTIAGKRSIQ
jgi:hypothetical protein